MTVRLTKTGRVTTNAPRVRNTSRTTLLTVTKSQPSRPRPAPASQRVIALPERAPRFQRVETDLTAGIEAGCDKLAVWESEASRLILHSFDDELTREALDFLGVRYGADVHDKLQMLLTRMYALGVHHG